MSENVQKLQQALQLLNNLSISGAQSEIMTRVKQLIAEVGNGLLPAQPQQTNGAANYEAPSGSATTAA